MKNDKRTFDVFALQDFFDLRLRFRGQIQMQIDFRVRNSERLQKREVMIDGVIVADGRINELIVN